MTKITSTLVTSAFDPGNAEIYGLMRAIREQVEAQRQFSVMFDEHGRAFLSHPPVHVAPPLLTPAMAA